MSGAVDGLVGDAMEPHSDSGICSPELAGALAREMATARSLGKLLRRTARLLAAHFAFDRLGVHLYDAESDSLASSALWSSAPDTNRQDVRSAPLPRPWRVLVEEQRGLSVRNLQAAEHPLALRAAAQGLAAGMVVPLCHAGEVVGVLVMLRREATPYGARDVQRLQQVADQLAPAIENKLLARRLARSAQIRRFQARLLDTVEQAVAVTDPEGKVTYWNHYAEKLFGWAAAEVKGRSLYEITLAQTSAWQGEEIMETIRAGESWSGEIVLCRRDGTTFPALLTNLPVADRRGQLVAIIGLGQDIGERKALQRAAATVSSSLHLDRVLDLILSALGRVLPYESATIFLLDGDEAEIVAARNLPEATIGSRFAVNTDPFLQEMSVNQRPIILDDARTHAAFEGWSGTGRVRGWLAVPLISAAGLTGYLTLDSYQPGTYNRTDADLALSFAQHAAMAVENARLHEDLRAHLADLRAAQSRLLQSEKLATIGELAAGVAHELNNPLAAILLYAQLLRRRAGADATGTELARIEEQTLRARDIVQSLLDFAQRRTPRYEPVQINEVLENSLSLINYSLQNHDIAVTLDLAPDLPPTRADPGQLQQVFVNILNNAYQAIRDGDEGTQVLLRTRQSASRFLPTRGVAAPRVIRVTLHNDGPPIPPENLPNIFDPFFTTKEPGEGTGLGLAVSYGIIQEHEGHIWTESGAGEGVTFFVELPILAPAVAGKEADGEAGDAPASADAVKGRALIIDDEPAMRVGLQDVLETLGFSAESVPDGRAGLDRLEEAGYALLLCDIRMPGLDGIAFYEQVQRLYPALAGRILFMTGDAVSRETRRFLEENGLPYLMKPFAIETLREKVQEIGEV